MDGREQFFSDYEQASWRDVALCSEHPYSTWDWIPDGEPKLLAPFKVLCLQCPVQNECEAYAKEYQCEGIWAGRFYPSMWWRESSKPIVEIDVDSRLE